MNSLSKQDTVDRSDGDAQSRLIGWLATITGVAMYLSYIDQIMRNIDGSKGSPLQAGLAMMNCSFWIAYGSVGRKRDWPIIVTNLPGVILGAAALWTSL